MAKKIFDPGTTQHTKQISEYAVKLNYNNIPAEVIERAKMMTLHTIGVSLAATPVGQVKAAINSARKINGGSGGSASVWIGGEKLSPIAASFANSTISDILDWEDCSWTGHPSASVIPVAMALSEDLKKGGKEFLTAVVTGFEVETRVSMSVQPPADFNHAHGWGIASWQIFASVAPAAKLFNFNQEKTNQAYGMACLYTPIASNLMQATMSNAYHYQYGFCSASGILGVINVQEGIDNLTDGLDIPFAYHEQLSSVPKREWLVKDLDKFLTMKILIKHWPANMWIQTPLEIVHDLTIENQIEPSQIEEIIIDPPTQYRMQFYEDGFSSLMDAQFSMPFCIASMLYNDKPGPNWYNRELFTNPKIIDLARRIKGGPSKEHTLNGSFVMYRSGDYPVKNVKITMKNGEIFERTQAIHKGHPDNMLTRQEFCDLFLNNACFAMPLEKARNLMNFILNLENVKNMAEIGKLF